MHKRIWRNFLADLKSQPLTQLAMAIILGLLVLSICAPLIGVDPNAIDVTNKSAPPSLAHPFGTDSLGRDYLSRALYGGRVSLMVGFSSVIISTLVGTLVGVVAAYSGGWVDALLMRLIDILMSIPNFFLIVILNTYLQPGLQNVILIMGFLSWMGLARIVRSEALSLKHSEFVQYSRGIGSRISFIMTRHLVMNIMPTIIVSATLNVGSAILTESSLSYFGLGVSQPNSSWGNMLNDARSSILTAPHLSVFPGVLILLTVLAFNLLGESLRRSLDTRNRLVE